MKTYLNQEERQIAAYFCICYGLIEAQLEARKNTISSEEITHLTKAHEDLSHYIESLIDRVGLPEGNRLMKMAEEYTVELKPRNYTGQFVVDKESLEEVARMAVETHCFNCTNTKWHDCGLYKCMDKCGMCSIKENNGKCEFYYGKEDNNGNT